MRYISHRPVTRWKTHARALRDCSVTVPSARPVPSAPLVLPVSPAFPFVTALCSDEDGPVLAPMRKLATNSLT